MGKEFAAHDCHLGETMTPAALWENLLCVEEFASDLAMAKELIQLCNTSTDKYEDEKQYCDALRGPTLQAMCNLEEETNDVCSSYTSCHSGAVEHFVGLRASLQALEDGRKAHAVAVGKIKCYLRTVLLVDVFTLAKNGTGEARLAACA